MPQDAPAPRPQVRPSEAGVSGAPRRPVSILLRAIAVAVFVFPASMVIVPLGGIGYVSLILALVLCAVWVGSALLGLHDPIPIRHPARVALGFILVVTCFSYGARALGLTGHRTMAGQAGADRWLILLLAGIAVAMVTAEVVRTMDDALVLCRALLAGAFFCCVVALIQFAFRIDPMQWVQIVMVGFTDNGGATAFQSRGLLMRVAGSTFHPIELGVVSAMLLPLSVWRALYDPAGWKPFHWMGTLLLVFAVAASVSRSAVLGLLVAVVVAVPFLPSLARTWAVIVVPFAVAALFVGVPGLIATLFGSITAGTSDPSISTRLDDYPQVEMLVSQFPFTGSGPGTYLPTNALEILDNQYLLSAVEMGLPGAVAVALYLTVPGVFALMAARCTAVPALRALAGAVAAAGLVAAVASATFDSFAFPVFSLLYPFFIGLSGAVWLAVKRERGMMPSTRDEAFLPATMPLEGSHGSRFCS